mmetsp:Transcript_34345/g.105535  ORF Transcript_34345/g.105535 Transcript_34345/m.105535 type:complete len:140 (+) Transcript_34345:241-660(+)
MADAKKPRARKRKTRDEDDDFDGDGADDASGAASGPLDLDRPASAVAKSILASLGAVGGRAAMSEHGSSPRERGSSGGVSTRPHSRRPPIGSVRGPRGRAPSQSTRGAVTTKPRNADRPLGIAAADTRIVAAGAAGNAD